MDRISSMKAFGRRLFACLLLAAAAAGCSSHALPKEMTDDQLREIRAKLAKGDTFQSFSPVTGTDLKHAQIYAVVDAPIERVWKIITDYNTYSDFVPLVEQSRIRWIKGRLVRVEWGFGLTGVPLKYKVVVAMVHYPKVHRVEWVYVEGDIRNTYGSWTLKPFGGDRTEVVYSMFMDLGGTVVGSLGPLVQLGSGAALPLVMDALRERAKDPRYDSLELPAFALPDREGITPVDDQFAAFD